MRNFTYAFLMFMEILKLNQNIESNYNWPTKEDENKVFNLIPGDKKEYWIKRYYNLKTLTSRWEMLNRIHMYWLKKEINHE